MAGRHRCPWNTTRAKKGHLPSKKPPPGPLAGKNALRALRDNEAMAAQGDAYAEMRMGERYRDGDCVPQDPAKARAYLGMAAAHGSLTADAELTRLENTAVALGR